MEPIKKQKKTKEEQDAFLLRLMKVLGIMSFITAAILLTLILIMRVDSFREKYDQYLLYIQDFEQKVASLSTNWLSVIVIFLLYLLRSLSAIYPFPALYIITAMVFSPVKSFLLNMACMTFVIAFRYFTGVQMGEGFWNDMLKKNRYIQAMFEVDARGNPVVLFALRFVPVFPFNTVSHLYGSMEYPFVKYVLISVAALVPRLISYSFIGKNIYDPLSSRFFVPLIFLFVLTGISFFVMHAVLKVGFRKNKQKEENAATEGADPAAELRPDENGSSLPAEGAALKAANETEHNIKTAEAEESAADNENKQKNKVPERSKQNE